MNPSTRDVPVSASGVSIPEATFRALALGLVLSVVMGAANTYLGLYAGMTVSASIPAAVISMGILRGILRRGTILENNIVQTMASAGESLAAGVIFTVPALVIIGEWQEFQFWPTTMIVLLGGVLGIAFMIPMRKALILDRPDLTYPEGVACAEVLRAGEEKGSGLRTIGLGLAIGAAFKFLVNGWQMIQVTVEGAVARGRSVFYFGSDMSAALMAVGYIVNLRVAALITLGGALGWIVALPLLGGYVPGASPLDVAWQVWEDHVRFIGVGAMIVGGLWSIWEVRKGITGAMSALRGTERHGDAALPRTERNIPMTTLGIIFLLTTFGTFLLYQFLTGKVGIASVTTIIMILAAFVMTAVATYIAGLVGSSNSPVSGMTIVALLLAAGVLTALGVAGDSAILATLGVAGVVCCVTCTSGDVAQDLKTGMLVGATPATQQWAQFLAAIVPAFFFAPVLTLLHQTYGIGTGEPGSLRAPQAALFASLTSGFFGEGTLPWNMIAIGAGLGGAIIAADLACARAGSRVRLPIMPVAVGMYLPLSLDIPILIGGLLRFFFGRRETEGEDVRDAGVLFGSGLIAGEALMGILLAILISAGLALPIVLMDHWSSSLALFALLTGFYFWIARRR